jgi:type IV pilus assembly protein PilC
VPATYSYRVRDRTGKVLTGAIEAESLTAVASKLRSMGYIVLDISEKKEGISLGGFSLFRRVKAKDLTVFTRQFATMINAGVSITKALGILADQTTNPTLSAVITQLQKDVEGGLSLSEALAKHPKVFPPIFVNMTRAGEAGGVLDEALLKIAEHFEKEEELKSRIKSALSYPIAVVSVATILVFVMITFIVPMFVKMFATMGGELPLPTRMLLVLSGFIRGIGGLFIFAAIVGVYFGYKIANSRPNSKFVVDSIKLKLPVMGSLVQKMSLAKFTRTFATLIASGVPILQAMDIVADTAGNEVVTRAVREARSSIKEGETISKPLAKSAVFPPMVVQMIAIGEETGALDAMLTKIADFYDAEVSATVDALTSILEPLLMLFLGVSVGGIVIALYMPMFSIITMIK